MSARGPVPSTCHCFSAAAFSSGRERYHATRAADSVKGNRSHIGGQWRWSTRFWPTDAFACSIGVSDLESWSCGPILECMRILGVLKAPAERMTS